MSELDLRPFRDAVAGKSRARQDAALHLHTGDEFQTDPEALLPLLPYLPERWIIWEAACGCGLLATGLRETGLEVIATDILTGHDALRYQPERWDAIVTNPPYSIKDKFIQRCYDLRKPFALLMPLTALEGQRRQSLYTRHGLQLLVLRKRPVFTTPNGKIGGSWFNCAWFCWGLPGLPDLSFEPAPSRPLALWDEDEVAR